MTAYWWHSSPENSAFVATLPTRAKDSFSFMATLARNAYEGVSSSLGVRTHSEGVLYHLTPVVSMISGAFGAFWTYLCEALLSIWTVLMLVVSYIWALLQGIWVALLFGARYTKDSVASFVSSSQVSDRFVQFRILAVFESHYCTFV